jgi:hypothetical protein
LSRYALIFGRRRQEDRKVKSRTIWRTHHLLPEAGLALRSPRPG